MGVDNALVLAKEDIDGHALGVTRRKGAAGGQRYVPYIGHHFGRRRENHLVLD